MKHVGTGKKVTLTAKTAGLPNGEPAEIEVFRAEDHASLGVMSTKVRSGRIACDWTAQGPDPFSEDPPWILYFKARCKGMETKAGKLQVYTDWLEVSAEDERGRPLPDAEFKVIVGDGEEVREATTGQEACRKEDYLPPGPVRVEWQAPYQLLEWLEQDGPRWKAKVRRACPAKLVWPAPPAGEEEAAPGPLRHAQWINLPPDPEHPDRGPRLALRVTLVDGAQGQSVYARLAWDEEARGDRPPPSIVGGRADEWCEQGGVEVQLPADDGLPDCEATIEVDLGRGGGDEVTLHLGGTEACGDQRLTVVNRRKLLAQVTRLEGQDFDPAPLQERLRGAAIELEVYHEELLSPAAPLPRGTLLDAAEVGGEGLVLNLGEHCRDELLRLRRRPDEAALDAVAWHLVVGGACFDLGPRGAPHEQSLEVEVSQPRAALTIDEPEVFDVFASDLSGGGPSLVEGSWDGLAPAGHAHHGRGGALTPAALEVDHARAPDTVTLVLEGEPRELLEADDPQPLRVLLSYRVAKGPGRGGGAADLLLVAGPELVDDALDGLGRALGIQLPPREDAAGRLDSLRQADCSRVRS